MVSRSRVHPPSRGTFKGVSIQTTGPTTSMTVAVYAPQAVISSQPLLSQGTVATLAADDADVLAAEIRDDTKPTSCASSARQFPSCSHVRPAFPSPRDTDRGTRLPHLIEGTLGSARTSRPTSARQRIENPRLRSSLNIERSKSLLGKLSIIRYQSIHLDSKLFTFRRKK